jgi:hypothetical protein
MPKLPRRNAVKDYAKNIAYIPLGRYISKGFAIVDLEDADTLQEYYWHTDTNGYPISTTGLQRGTGNIYMHTLVCPVRKGYHTDHINRNVKDNRSSNLREATVEENMQNRRTHQTLNRTSKHKGVCFVGKSKNAQWQYSLYSIHLPKGKVYGYTATEEEAISKRAELVKQYRA